MSMRQLLHFINVLILIVVEDGLVQHSAMSAVQLETVLILIVVEDGLVQ